VRRADSATIAEAVRRTDQPGRSTGLNVTWPTSTRFRKTRHSSGLRQPVANLLKSSEPDLHLEHFPVQPACHDLVRQLGRTPERVVAYGVAPVAVMRSPLRRTWAFLCRARSDLRRARHQEVLALLVAVDDLPAEPFELRAELRQPRGIALEGGHELRQRAERRLQEVS